MKCKSKECSNEFNPVTSMQKYCFNCTIAKVKKNFKTKKEKEYRQKKKETNLKLKTYTQKVNEVKKVFQKWVRFRDKDLPCISCGTYSCNEWAGGHYFKAEIYRGLIFDERNCHKQCNAYCNKFRDGAQAEYRIGLVKRYGESYVKGLEDDSIKMLKYKYSDDELKELKEKYKI